MKPNMKVVRVTAREGANIEELAGHMGSTSVACGTAGPSIARQIIEGAAETPLSLIRMATDTQSGVEAIFDNFVLSDPRTGEPLVHLLLH